MSLLLELQPASSVTMRWFGHVELKDSSEWIRRCMTTDAVGTRQRHTTEEDMTALCPGGYEEFRPVSRGCTVQEKSRKIKGANS